MRGSIDIPGDKSISHRAVLFNALAHGSARITHFLTGADCLATIACLRALGVAIGQEGDTVVVHGRGHGALHEAADVLDCGNSGTTMRLLAGVLAGCDGRFSVLSGDASLRSRPQRRIVAPLRALGAQIDGRDGGERAPLAIRGARLHAGSYDLPIASAQVKSALLLAALCAGVPLDLGGRIDGRDHTERMLRGMGVALTLEGGRLRLTPGAALQPCSLRVPGDPSSAAFWWVAAAIHPDAEITTCGVGMNASRGGALEVLQAMGADLTVSAPRTEGDEPVADVTVRSSALRGTVIEGAIIPRLIDEIPVLAVAAACARGTTVVRDAQELRAKETDRISTVVGGLRALGVAVEAADDGFRIDGGRQLAGAALSSHGDHRLAMAWAVAALAARDAVLIDDAGAVDVSYPAFWATLEQLGAA
jgi:3-phosphoshikimate 1-carboxyvinyltransferase